MSIKPKLSLQGFTLLELLVVIALIGIFAAVTLAALSDIRADAKITVAKAELRTIQKAMMQLSIATGVTAGGYPPSRCRAASNAQSWGNGLSVNDSRAGLVLNDTNPAKYPNWNGPYLQAMSDPWGNAYILESYYRCHSAESAVAEGQCLTGQWVSAIISPGPNGSGANTYDGDNIALVLCSHGTAE